MKNVVFGSQHLVKTRFCHKETIGGTVYFQEDHLPWGNWWRSFRISNKNSDFSISISRKIDLPETFAHRFPNFADIDWWPEEEFLGSSRRIEWLFDCLDTTSLRRDTIFEYATSSAIPTFRVSLWHFMLCASLSVHMGLSFEHKLFLGCSQGFSL